MQLILCNCIIYSNIENDQLNSKFLTSYNYTDVGENTNGDNLLVRGLKKKFIPHQERLLGKVPPAIVFVFFEVFVPRTSTDC